MGCGGGHKKLSFYTSRKFMILEASSYQAHCVLFVHANSALTILFSMKYSMWRVVMLAEKSCHARIPFRLSRTYYRAAHHHSETTHIKPLAGLRSADF